MAIRHNLDELCEQSKNILLLQGPVGAFFYEFAQWLKAKQKRIFKLNFNAGDEFFFPNDNIAAFPFLGELDDFLLFLEKFCSENHIDNIVCFGDTRPYHSIAKEYCKKFNVGFWVFEEGYFRPHYITFEKHGVNDYSSIPRDANYFLGKQNDFNKLSSPIPLAQGFCSMAKLAVLYYFVANLKNRIYPNYQHHRKLNIGYYLKLWLISGVKRAYYYLHDLNFSKKIQKGKISDFFIVPLQVYDDSQVRIHSDYDSVEKFLRTVLDSFIANAPKYCNLIIKHHPMDRGFIDYGCVINEYKKRYPELKKRLFYIHDVPMPVFLRHGLGMVTLNSTSGLSALLHNMPVITLGKTNYHFPQMTHQGELDEFWCEPQKPKEAVFNAYRQYHLHKTQINGSFYSRVILERSSSN